MYKIERKIIQGHQQKLETATLLSPRIASANCLKMSAKKQSHQTNLEKMQNTFTENYCVYLITFGVLIQWNMCNLFRRPDSRRSFRYIVVATETYRIRNNTIKRILLQNAENHFRYSEKVFKRKEFLFTSVIDKLYFLICSYASESTINLT